MKNNNWIFSTDDEYINSTNFMNNQNYIVAKKNRYFLYKNKEDIENMRVTVLIFITIVLVLLIKKYVSIIWNIFKYFELNYNVSEIFSFIVLLISVYIIIFYVESTISNFLLKWKKYLFLKKNPKLNNWSTFDYRNKSLDNFIILKLNSKKTLFWYIKLNIINIIIIFIKSIYLSLVPLAVWVILTAVWSILIVPLIEWLILDAIHIDYIIVYITLYIISFLLTFFYLFINNNKIKDNNWLEKIIIKSLNIKDDNNFIVTIRGLYIFLYILLFLVLLIIISMNNNI